MSWLLIFLPSEILAIIFKKLKLHDDSLCNLRLTSPSLHGKFLDGILDRRKELRTIALQTWTVEFLQKKRALTCDFVVSFEPDRDMKHATNVIVGQGKYVTHLFRWSSKCKSGDELKRLESCLNTSGISNTNMKAWDPQWQEMVEMESIILEMGSITMEMGGMTIPQVIQHMKSERIADSESITGMLYIFKADRGRWDVIQWCGFGGRDTVPITYDEDAFHIFDVKTEELGSLVECEFRPKPEHPRLCEIMGENLLVSAKLMVPPAIGTGGRAFSPN